MRLTALAVLLCAVACPPSGRAQTRPLPVPVKRPLAPGQGYHVDPVKGNDSDDGSLKRPWRTLAHALTRLKSGQTLYLRGGVYHEVPVMSLTGKPGQPITIRSFPGELAVLDGGFPEFLTRAKTAWEPVKGSRDEYRSTKTYPALRNARRGVRVLGNFAQSLVPLHGYRFVCDFRSDNPYWTLKNNRDDKTGVWCGPGLWFDPAGERIHVRLAHTNLRLLGKANYTGETDPRKLPLVVAGPATPLRLDRARHLRLQDLVVRGSAAATVEVAGCEAVEMDGLTILGGSPAVAVRATTGLRLLGCVVRGLTAPWSSRASHKYRGNSAYLFTVSAAAPGCKDFELAFCEFTDNHDGLILGTLRNLKFHHNLVDHFDDDGLYLTLKRPRPPEGLHIYQNVFRRCLTTFAFAQSGKGVRNEVGPGAYIFRNVFDLRKGTPSTPPASAKDDVPGAACWNREGRIAGDHGSPIWEPMFFYHNTVLTAGPAFRNYCAAGLAGHMSGTRRRVFNNLFVQVEGSPGLNFPAATEDLEARGNLHWGISAGPGVRGDYFAKFRASALFRASQKQHPPGWTSGDLFADPKFVDLAGGDLGLSKDSPARGAGIALPADWPDPLRKAHSGKPDMGALPPGSEPLRVGPAARR
jgi:hypothetical protein